MQTAASVTIERPIEEVFDFTVNHVAEWSVVVESDEIIDEKPEGVGTTFRVVTRGHGCRMEFDGLVTRHVRPALHTVVMKGKQFDIEVDYSFEEHHGLTSLTQTSTIHPKGFTKVIFFLLGWRMKKPNCDALEKELENLKHLLESRQE